MDPNKSQLVQLIVATILILAPIKLCAQTASSFGTFSPAPAVRPLADDARAMILLEDFSFTDAKKRMWTAKTGLRTDGASIPPLAWSLVGSPFTGLYRLPAIIHDQYCEDKTLATSDDVHDMFYNAMRAAGVGKGKALVMWTAVYVAGPHWRKKTDENGKEVLETFYYVPLPAEPPSRVAENLLRTEDIEGTKNFVEQTYSTEPRRTFRLDLIYGGDLKDVFDKAE